MPANAVRNAPLSRELARSVGAELEGTLEDIKASTKYILNILPRPIVIIDEAGCLSYSSLQLLHEFWNGTAGYMRMVYDGRGRPSYQVTKKAKGKSKKQSYKELVQPFLQQV